MYLELADFPKIINTKLDQGKDRLAQTLVFHKFSYIYRNIQWLNLLRRNIMMEIAVRALSLCQGQRPDDQKDSNQTKWPKQRQEKASKPKAVIFVPTPTNRVLKYLILLLQHP